MLSSLRCSRGRVGLLAALAASVLGLTAGQAGAQAPPTNAPTFTSIDTYPKGSTRLGNTVVPLANVVVPNFDFYIPGTFTFWVCGPAALDGCPTGGTALGTRGTLGGGSRGPVAGPAFNPPQPGSYCFRAEYSGSPGSHQPSSQSGSSSAGCIRVHSPVTLTYSFSAPPVVGTPFRVVFDLKDHLGNPVVGALSVGEGNGCSSGGPWSQTIPLVNGKATTAPYTPTSTAAPAISWQLPTSGGYDLLAACTWVQVAPAPTTSTLSLSASSVIAGQSVTATTRVSAPGSAGTPPGFSRFYVCGPLATPDGCASGGSQVGNGSTLVGGSATSNAFKPVAAGFYCFRADYYPATNPNFAGSSVDGPSKCVELATAGAGMSFFVSPEGDLGEDTRIWARVTRPGGTPTGSVRFARCGPLATPAGCPNPTGAYSNRPQLYNGQVESAWFKPQAPGYYCLWAMYEGDAQTPGITEDGPSSCFAWSHWRSTTSRSAPGQLALKGGRGPTGKRFNVQATTLKPGGAQGSVASWVCGPLSEPSGCKSGGRSLGSRALVAGAATTDQLMATGVGHYCVRSAFTSSDGEVRDSSSGSDADDDDPSCVYVGLGWKNLEVSPLTKVEGDPDPTPRLADIADPTITGSPDCQIDAHPEAPGTYEEVVWCDVGTLESPDWNLGIGRAATLTIMPKPKATEPGPDPKPDPKPEPDPSPSQPGGGTPNGAPDPTTPAAAPAAPLGGGALLLPPPVAAPSNVATIAKLTGGGGAVTLTLGVPGPGRVLVAVRAGKKQVTRTVSASKSGPLTVKFTAKQLRKLTAKTRKGKKVKLTVQAEFTPTGGAPGTVGPRTVSLKVR